MKSKNVASSRALSLLNVPGTLIQAGTSFMDPRRGMECFADDRGKEIE